MSTRFFSVALLFIVVFLGIQVSYAQNPIDKNATPETRDLYKFLLTSPANGIMFGHEDDLAKGIGWQYVSGRSDIKEVQGDYPAIYGWDLGDVEVGGAVNPDKVDLKKIVNYIKQVDERGGINTLSWHCRNPVDTTRGSKVTRRENTVATIFSDPQVLSRYKRWLNLLADYFLNLKDKDGKLIPVIFRPYHECNGNWYWWGKSNCSPQEYIKLWRFTVDYLKSKKVNNLLYVYATDKFTTEEEYLSRYPGDDYVDILGFDLYDYMKYYPGNKLVPIGKNMLSITSSLGKAKGKPYAITEIGFKKMPLANWWTETLNPIIANSGISYFMFWRNAGLDGFWSIYPGSPSIGNFKQFSQQPTILFQKSVTQKRMNIK